MSTAVAIPHLVVRNPSTGAVLGQIDETPPGCVAGIVSRARETQSDWGASSWERRRGVLKAWWAVLSREAEDWAKALRDEHGKPGGEATGEVVATLDAVRWTVKRAGRVLGEARIGPGWQRFMRLGPARLR